MNEEHLIQWVRSLGSYESPEGQQLTKAGVAKFLKTSDRRLWERLTQRFRPQHEVATVRQKVADSKQNGVHSAEQLAEVRRCAQLQVRIAQLEAGNKSLGELWDWHTAQLQLQVQRTVGEQSRLVQTRLQEGDTALQCTAHDGYAQRCQQLLPALDDAVSRFQQTTGLARVRQGAPAGAGDAAARAARLQQVCTAIRLELQQQVSVLVPLMSGSAVAQQDESTQSEHPASSSSEQLLQADSPPLLSLPQSGPLHSSIHACLSQPPPGIIHALAQVTLDASQRLVALVEAAESGRQPPGSALSHYSSGPHPSQLLKERQRLHLQRFFATEEALNQANAEQQRLVALASRPAGAKVLTSPMAQLQIQVAGLQAETAVLRGEVARLEAELTQWRDSELQLVRKADIYSRQREHDRSIHQLITKLMCDNRAMRRGWMLEAEADQVLLQQHLPSACTAVMRAAAAAEGLMQRELAAVHDMPVAAQVSCSTLSSSQQATLLPFASASAPSGPSVIASFARAARQVSILPSPTSNAHSSYCVSGSDSHGPDLVLMLRSACLLDSLTPLRCPSSMVLTITGRHRHLRRLQDWLHDTTSTLQRHDDAMQTRNLRSHALQQRVEAKCRNDQDVLLAMVRAAATQSAAAQAFLQQVEVGLRDWWTQPAVHLVPWKTHNGMTASDYMSTIEAMYCHLREGTGR